MAKQKPYPLKLSASSMDQLDGCGLRFRLKFVEGMREEGFSAAGAFGTAFHKVAQIMYEVGTFERKFMLAQWPDVFNETFSNPNLEKQTKEQIDNWRKSGYPVLNMFFSKEEKDGMLKPAIALEKRFEIPYKQLKDGRDVLLVGSIDRIIKKSKTKVEITDYKTTVSKPMSPTELLATIQMPLYSMAYRYLHKTGEPGFEIPDHYINMFYVRQSVKVIAEVEKEHRINLKKKIDHSIERILDKDFAPKKADTWAACKGCTFKSICPAFGGKLPDFEAMRKKKAEEQKRLENADIKLGRIRKWVDEDGMKKEIKPEQIKDVAHMSRHKTVLNANGVGAGKTVESIALVEHLHEEHGAKKVLLLLPKPLRGQWKQQIRNWTGVKGLAQIIKDVSLKERAKLYGKKLWTIANYDKVISDYDTISQIDWDVLICDECQRLAGTSKSAKMIKAIRAPRKIALTATPISSRLDKLFRIMAYVRPGHLGPWSEFQKRHFIYDGSGKLTGFKNLLEIRDKLGPYIIRRTRREIFPDAKDPLIEPVLLDMSPRQKALYQENIDDLERLLESDKLDEERTVSFIDSPAGAKWMKLRRMLDFTHLIDGGKFDSPKYEFAKEIIEDVIDAEEKIIIFSQYLTVIQELRKQLTKDGFKNILEISGGEKRDRDEVRELFNKSKEHKILLMTDSGKFGLNLQGGNNMINFELPEDPEVITQRIGRITRPEQMRDMHVWNLMMKKTFEVKIHKRRHLRAQVSSVIIDQSMKKDVVNLKDANILSIKGLKEILL